MGPAIAPEDKSLLAASLGGTGGMAKAAHLPESEAPGRALPGKAGPCGGEF